MNSDVFNMLRTAEVLSVKWNDLMSNAKVWTEGFEENDYMSADLNHAEELFLTSNQTTIN